MSRRFQQSEMQFGSDSFLDVIANIVGILIILTVLVGLQVARQPPEDPNVVTEVSASAVESVAGVSDERRETLRARQAELTASDLRIGTLTARLTELNQELLVSRQQLKDLENQLQGQVLDIRHREAALRTVDQEAEQLKMQQASLSIEVSEQSAARERTDARFASANAELTVLRTRVEALRQTVEKQDAAVLLVVRQLNEAKDQKVELEENVRQVITETQALREVLQAEAKNTPPADRLQHRLSPVGQTVSGPELHFRVSQGRVSHIPLDELLERMQTQLRSRSAMVMRYGRTEGTVGPVEGYLLSYTAEGDGGSMLAAVQNGETSFRIRVSRWALTNTSSLPEERVEDAVRPGSRFRQTMEASPLDSSVTFWVYEDSFDDFAALREYAHAQEFRVAARPLPEGTPIVGSPNGSTSTAQ
ncbi:MAG: hypothetical protein KDA85_15705 [Planctomycetaceae bacterium]|nr:hypothetical protein [Planctomycetaceae bacterium]